MSNEHRYRSLIKAISYRITGTIFTFLVAYLFTGEALIALSIGAVEAVSKIFIYYWHERLWDKIQHGKRITKPEYEI
jgi:uncharacterized membrane protein